MSEKFLCDICMKNFSSKQALYRHKKHRVKPCNFVLRCETCGQIFRTNQEYEKHKSKKNPCKKKKNIPNCKIQHLKSENIELKNKLSFLESKNNLIKLLFEQNDYEKIYFILNNFLKKNYQ